MDSSRLAAKNKRVKDWQEFADTQVSDPIIKRQMLSTLTTYRAALAKHWLQSTLDDASLKDLTDLERQLDQLNSEARLLGAIRPAQNG